ncbi:MAG: hypothetical protein J6V30_00845 [Paludibacteraceae bacterium]|nr:hypothetical protein [Paludibacteraceae bacterium]
MRQKNPFAQLQIELKQAIDHDLPIIIGNEAVRLFKKNFQDEGFFGKPWQQVKRRQTHTVKYKTKSGMRSRIVPKAKGAAGTRKILFDKKKKKASYNRRKSQAYGRKKLSLLPQIYNIYSNSKKLHSDKRLESNPKRIRYIPRVFYEFSA